MLTTNSRCILRASDRLWRWKVGFIVCLFGLGIATIVSPEATVSSVGEIIYIAYFAITIAVGIKMLYLWIKLNRLKKLEE
jgi:hypothetical protein